ncbi:MAG: hypothetical protein KKD48_01130 [Nanoarchaeota archaeon]|nr:hypothetical protein [Nanoarchaeota archaeon]
MQTKTIVEAIIIVIVVAFLILIPTKGWSIVKYITDWDVEGQFPISSEQITTEFDNIASDYENCFNSKNNNCLCNINVQLFPENYAISYDSSYRMDIIRLRSGIDIPAGLKDFGNIQGIKRKEFLGKTINCYLYYNCDTKKYEIGLPNSKTTTSYLLVGQSPIKLYLEPQVGNLIYYPFSGLYKIGNDICFLVPFMLAEKRCGFFSSMSNNALVKEGQDYINNLPKC